MDKSLCLKRLAETAELLLMLEHLTEGLNSTDGSIANRLPLGGMALTLGDCRSKVLSAYENILASFGEDYDSSEPTKHSSEGGVQRADESAEGKKRSKKSATSSTLSRVQRSPQSSGRVRDITDRSKQSRSTTAEAS